MVCLIAATTVLKVLFIQLGIFFKLKSSRLSYVQICLLLLYCPFLAQVLLLSRNGKKNIPV